MRVPLRTKMQTRSRKQISGRSYLIRCTCALASCKSLTEPISTVTMSSGFAVYLDIHIGDKDDHARKEAAYNATNAILAKNASIYGLPSRPQDLSDEQREILQELDVSIVLHRAVSQADETVECP